MTQPDRPRGRSGKPRPPAIKEAALGLGIDVIQPQRLSEVVDAARSCDIGVLVAFGRLIKPDLLEAPRRGIVNVHFSVLPRWRGAAPVQAALLHGDSRSGVSLMQMDAGLDTGPVLRTAETPIDATENAGELTVRLADLGADLLAGSLADLVAGDIEAVPQDEAGATIAAKLEPAAARLRPISASAAEMERTIRALSPRPGAWAELEGERFKILAARHEEMGPAPGVVEDVDGAAVLGTANGALVLALVQPAGKQVMSGAAWLNGRQGRPTSLN